MISKFAKSRTLFLFTSVMAFALSCSKLAGAMSSRHHIECSPLKTGDLSTIQEYFQINQDKADIEEILVQACGYTARKVDVGDKDKYFYIYSFADQKQKYIITYTSDNKLWELQFADKRVLPRDGREITHLTPVPSISKLRLNPREFRFEFFTDRRSFASALPQLLPVGTTKDVVEVMLIEGGGAKNSSYNIFDRTTGQFTKIGESYTYFARSADGRRHGSGMYVVNVIFSNEKISRTKHLYFESKKLY